MNELDKQMSKILADDMKESARYQPLAYGISKKDEKCPGCDWPMEWNDNLSMQQCTNPNCGFWEDSE